MAIIPGRCTLRGDGACLCVPRLSKESLHIVNEQRVQSISDLFPIGVLEGTLEWDPERY